MCLRFSCLTCDSVTAFEKVAGKVQGVGNYPHVHRCASSEDARAKTPAVSISVNPPQSFFPCIYWCI